MYRFFKVNKMLYIVNNKDVNVFLCSIPQYACQITEVKKEDLWKTESEGVIFY